jgi:hypothetical protein
MTLTGKSKELGDKPVPVQLCPPHVPESDPGANPGLRNNKPVTNHLSHGTALASSRLKHYHDL